MFKFPRLSFIDTSIFKCLHVCIVPDAAAAVFFCLIVTHRNGVAPVVALDAKKYKLVQQLDAAMAVTPSLIGCDRLTVTGEVRLVGETVFKVRHRGRGRGG